MLSWRATLGLAAVAAVLLALLLPWPGREPAVRIAPPAQGASQPAAEVFQGMISVEGKQVPLPPGDWQIAGRAVSTNSSRSVLSVALVHLRGADVDAAVLVQTNKLDTDPAWGKATACDRTDLYYAEVRYASDHDGSCAYAAYVDANVKTDSLDPAWQAAVRHSAGKGWHLPRQWLEAAYRITDPRDAIQVRYLFDPPNGADRAAVRALVSWTEASWRTVGTGFRNRLGVEDGLPDWRQSNVTNASAVLPKAGEEESKVEHLGTKMITYRIFGTMTDMSVNYLWLGSLPSAGGLAVVGAIASSVLYFVHELVWSHFEQQPALVGDLPGAGIEKPGPA